MRKPALCALFVLPLLAQSNPELARIYDEDQKDRADWQRQTPISQQRMARRDAQRRTQVARLLTSGALRTGQDYERAAFIFQHGDQPSDYLRAHVLAMTASAVEAGRGTWIAAATLDRYLHSTGKPQVFGTQLSDKEPFEREFVPDSIRTANCVPSIADRERMAQAIANRQPMPKITPCAPQWNKLTGTWSITEVSHGEGFAHALLIIPAEDEHRITFTENGKNSTVDQIAVVDRELRLRVHDREYVFSLATDSMRGVVNRPGGDQRPVVALHGL